jgi:AraC-like DNA-binding protein
MDVLVHVDGRGQAAVSVVGTMTRAIVAPPVDPGSASARASVDSGSATGFAGIRFRPGEAFAFLDVAADDARDAFLTPCEAGLGPLDELAEEIAGTSSNRWAGALNAWLLGRLPRARAADRRVRKAVEAFDARAGRARVRDVASELGVSERQLERAFRERVGLSPKQLARVIRLQRFSASLESQLASGMTVDWAAIATECSYADQAHLVREVHALAGVTPTELARERMSGSFNTARQSSAIQRAY